MNADRRTFVQIVCSILASIFCPWRKDPNRMLADSKPQPKPQPLLAWEDHAFIHNVAKELLQHPERDRLRTAMTYVPQFHQMLFGKEPMCIPTLERPARLLHAVLESMLDQLRITRSTNLSVTPTIQVSSPRYTRDWDELRAFPYLVDTMLRELAFSLRHEWEQSRYVPITDRTVYVRREAYMLEIYCGYTAAVKV